MFQYRRRGRRFALGSCQPTRCLTSAQISATPSLPADSGRQSSFISSRTLWNFSPDHIWRKLMP